MKFIEINSKLRFRKEDVMGVELIEEGGEDCKIITMAGKFSCRWPASTLIKFLEVEDSDISSSKGGGLASKQNLWGTQHFAG